MVLHGQGLWKEVMNNIYSGLTNLEYDFKYILHE